MKEDLTVISILARREIEARIAGPLIKAFMDEVGREKAFEIAGGVIRSLALESGRMLAEVAGERVHPGRRRGTRKPPPG